MRAYARVTSKSILDSSSSLRMTFLTVEIVIVRSDGTHSVAKFTRKINAVIKVIIKPLSRSEFPYAKWLFHRNRKMFSESVRAEKFEIPLHISLDTFSDNLSCRLYFF